MAQNKETTIDELAMMVQKGFEGVTYKINGMKDEMKGVKKQLSTVVTEIDNLQRGQEHIEERLDEMMTRSEVNDQNIKIKEHDRRIRVLEKKVLFAR